MLIPIELEVSIFNPVDISVAVVATPIDITKI